MESVVGLWWRLVRFGFRLLYNEMAFTYDLVSKVVSLGMWRCWQRAALRHLPPPGPAPLLELAHGTGDLQIDLHNAGYTSIGFDLSPYMGRITRRKLGRHAIPAALTRGDAQMLPFADNAFPAIACTFPTPFIIQPETLAEIHRVLQPGGRLVVVPSGVLTGDNPPEAVLEWLYRITGQREGDADSFVGAFQRAGFVVTGVQERCPRSLVVVIVAEKPE
ncbi:MAG: class I SAM-dependent methyltransferase [Chloroflexota bacterium]